MRIKAILIAFTGIFTLLSVSTTQAQKYFTKDAKVTFDATAKSSPEQIVGTSGNGTLVLDKSTGEVAVAILLKGIQFEKALMQEHFNENYLETSKYPKAEFKGKLENPGAVDLTKDGNYSTNVTGTVTMHGQTKSITAPVTFSVKGGQIRATSKFMLTLADFNIQIPSLVADKVAKVAVVNVNANLAPLK